MYRDFTDQQTEALISELHNIVQNDPYPLSPRIRVLDEILGMLRRRACWRPGFDRVLARGWSRLRLAELQQCLRKSVVVPIAYDTDFRC
jgi:hypothetical protein